jgi:hypothetical protein
MGPRSRSSLVVHKPKNIIIKLTSDSVFTNIIYLVTVPVNYDF